MTVFAENGDRMRSRRHYPFSSRVVLLASTSVEILRHCNTCSSAIPITSLPTAIRSSICDSTDLVLAATDFALYHHFDNSFVHCTRPPIDLDVSADLGAKQRS